MHANFGAGPFTVAQLQSVVPAWWVMCMLEGGEGGGGVMGSSAVMVTTLVHSWPHPLVVIVVACRSFTHFMISAVPFL